MSSICGVLRRDGRPVEAADLARMVDVLAHWTPDARGTWHDETTGLGHLALWSTPEAVNERCPWRDPASGIVVTADARIDNRDELIHSLGLGARPAAEIGDVELIGHAYLAWGEACAEHLVGDFALAVWDPRRRRLYCARDPMGVRPFFYFLDQKRFLFGSEIKAIFTEPEVPRELDFRQVAAALSGLPTFDDTTSFKAIRALEPATALCVDREGLRTWKYWRLELGREIQMASDDDYVDAFEAILQQAINARLRSTGRVGCLLSGGLDATTCLGVALRRGNLPVERMSAFSWALREGDDWWEPDERPFIDAFLRENPVDHAYVFADASRLFDLPPEMRAQRDGPEWRVDHCQMVPTFEAARARGVRALIHGVGGDETVSYAAPDFVLSRLLAGDWAALRAEVDGQPGKAARWRKWQRLLRPLLSRSRWRTPITYQWMYQRRAERIDDAAELGIPLRPEVARETDLANYVREVSRPRLPGAWREPVRATQIYMLTQTHVMSDQLAAWGYSSSYGIECRCPYLDRRVIEFAVQMPPRQHRHAGVGRRLLRRVAMRYLPGKIAGRGDKSVTMPDLARSVCQFEETLLRRIGGWRADARVTRVIDLDRMELDLRAVVEKTQARSPEWTPVLPLCRGVLLAGYLEDSY